MRLAIFTTTFPHLQEPPEVLAGFDPLLLQSLGNGCIGLQAADHGLEEGCRVGRPEGRSRNRVRASRYQLAIVEQDGSVLDRPSDAPPELDSFVGGPSALGVQAFCRD